MTDVYKRQEYHHSVFSRGFQVHGIDSDAKALYNFYIRQRFEDFSGNRRIAVAKQHIGMPACCNNFILCVKILQIDIQPDFLIRTRQPCNFLGRH